MEEGGGRMEEGGREGEGVLQHMKYTQLHQKLGIYVFTCRMMLCQPIHLIPKFLEIPRRMCMLLRSI